MHMGFHICTWVFRRILEHWACRSGIYGNYCTQSAQIRSLAANMPVDVQAKHNMPFVQKITASC